MARSVDSFHRGVKVIGDVEVALVVSRDGNWVRSATPWNDGAYAIGGDLIDNAAKVVRSINGTIISYNEVAELNRYSSFHR